MQFKPWNPNINIDCIRKRDCDMQIHVSTNVDHSVYDIQYAVV